MRGGGTTHDHGTRSAIINRVITIIRRRNQSSPRPRDYEVQLVANIKSGSTWMSLLLSHFFTRLYSTPAAAAQMIRHSSLLQTAPATATATDGIGGGGGGNDNDGGGGSSSSSSSSSSAAETFTPAACDASEFEMAYNPVLRRSHCCVLFFRVDQCQAMRAAATAGGVPSNLDALVAARMSSSAAKNGGGGGAFGGRGGGGGMRGSGVGGHDDGDSNNNNNATWPKSMRSRLPFNLRQAVASTEEARRDVLTGAVIGALASGFPVFSADKHLQYARDCKCVLQVLTATFLCFCFPLLSKIIPTAIFCCCWAAAAFGHRIPTHPPTHRVKRCLKQHCNARLRALAHAHAYVQVPCRRGHCELRARSGGRGAPLRQ
jgi:hypothetical protein